LPVRLIPSTPMASMIGNFYITMACFKNSYHHLWVLAL
jgi:hypothetical protein